MNLDRRLSNLRVRRQGVSAAMASDSSVYADSATKAEKYEQRSSNKATRYALGAMQEVDEAYTANSFAEGDRVKNQLQRAMSDVLPVAFEYQGSVPLNVHIRGVSDIDLLILRTDFVTIDDHGSKAHTYGIWTGDTAAVGLARLRSLSEVVLRDAFPEVTVDTTGAKSIALSGGSLRRKVDVVPSHWHDTVQYQASGQQRDRGVSIFVRNEHRTMKNFPFLHIHKVHWKDGQTNGGVKKVIRLLKNLRSDSDYATHIKLSSYDIAGIVWHFENQGLTVYPWAELSLIAVTAQHLEMMTANKEHTMKLMTPDGTRYVIDSEEKFTGLALLKLEVDQLADEVAKELSYAYVADQKSARRSLKEAYIP